MTNFEKIKAMSIDELAEALILGNTAFCTAYETDCIHGWHGSDCIGHAKQWLEAEAEE